MPKRRVSVKNYPVQARVPKPWLDEIEELVRNGLYLSVGDYVRDVIRNDIQARRAASKG